MSAPHIEIVAALAAAHEARRVSEEAAARSRSLVRDSARTLLGQVGRMETKQLVPLLEQLLLLDAKLGRRLLRQAIRTAAGSGRYADARVLTQLLVQVAGYQAACSLWRDLYGRGFCDED